MAWIESHSVLIRHKKLRELARELRIRPSYAMGHLHALWHAALEQREDGDLSSWSDDFIAETSDFNGDAPQYVRLLQKHGWLEGRLIHDWLDYAGLFLIKKYSTSNRDRLVSIWKIHNRDYGVSCKRTVSEPLASLPNLPNLPNLPHTEARVREPVPETVIKTLENRLNALYKRPETDMWSYAEQTAIVEISRRKSCLDEFDHIIAMRRSMPQDDRKRFFPRSLYSLLSKWTETLDRARIQCPVKAVRPTPTVVVKKPEKPLDHEMLRQSISFLETHHPESPMLFIQKKQLEELERK